VSALSTALPAVGNWIATEVTWLSGKWFFVAALALLLVWLVLMPRKLIGQSQHTPPWWRNVRVWAIVTCGIQIIIYAFFA
jgi:hypothetical protein